MPRVQLALNVSDIDAAVDFYSKLFASEPAKRRPGYANFAIADPPLKLVLIEDHTAREPGVGGALNHLGVEVDSVEDVHAATRQFATAGLPTLQQEATTCCCALQDKAWVNDPDGSPWEFYTVVGDAPQSTNLRGDGSCCTPDGACATAASEPNAVPPTIPSTCC